MNSRCIPQRHVLVVDDDAPVRETVLMLLRSDGHRAAGASDAAQALALFEPGKFDLVLTDYFMPAMNGDVLAATIRQRSPSQTIVMLTAFPEKLQSPGQAPPKVDLIMTKPFEIGELRDAVARCDAPNSGFSI